MFDYENLEITKLAEEIIDEVYKIELPKYETYALKDQLIRSATSIALNIAEGNGRGSNKEFIRFLYIAKGSVYETYEAVKIVEKIYNVDLSKLKQLLLKESKKIYNFIKYLMNK